MAQPKRELVVGEKGYIPASHVWIHRPGNRVYVNRRFFADESSAGNGAVMVERVASGAYRLTLRSGFRVERYSESEAHTAQLLPVAQIVDESGATHTTMPDRYIVLR